MASRSSHPAVEPPEADRHQDEHRRDDQLVVRTGADAGFQNRNPGGRRIIVHIDDLSFGIPPRHSIRVVTIRHHFHFTKADVVARQCPAVDLVGVEHVAGTSPDRCREHRSFHRRPCRTPPRPVKFEQAVNEQSQAGKDKNTAEDRHDPLVVLELRFMVASVSSWVGLFLTGCYRAGRAIPKALVAAWPDRTAVTSRQTRSTTRS